MVTIKYILVIKGVGSLEYEDIKGDLTKQYQLKQLEPPIFCYLPGEYPEIEVVWVDEEMEKYHFSTTVGNRIKETSSNDLLAR